MLSAPGINHAALPNSAPFTACKRVRGGWVYALQVFDAAMHVVVMDMCASTCLGLVFLNI